MNVFLEKSTTSIQAADLLIKEGCYSSSVHCSYYSVYQRMAYILKYILGERDPRIWKDPVGSHDRAINRISEAAIGRDKIKGRNLHTYIGRLKNNRVTADYNDTIIDPTFSEEARKSAGMILVTLNEIFKININP